MLSRTKILVVEDNQDMLDHICDALREHGHIVTGVASSADACDALDQNEFDVILSDIHMAEVNGLELSQMLRDANTKTLRVAMTGGHIEEADAKEAGFWGLLKKPFSIRELLHTLDQALTSN